MTDGKPDELHFARVPLADIWGSLGDFNRVTVEITRLVADIDRGMRMTLVTRDIVAAAAEALLASEKVKRQAEAFEEFGRRAQKTIDEGHQLLHRNLLIGVWGAFEAAVEDIVVFWIRAHPRHFEFDGLQRLKVAAGPFLQLDEDARARFLVREMQRSRGAEQRLGVGQFESLLDQVGLGGAVDEDCRRDLLEAQQLRHVIAHRGGVADADFQTHCGYLGYAVGEPVVVAPERFRGMVASMSSYVSQIIERVEAVLHTTAPTLWEGLQEVKRQHFPVLVSPRDASASDAAVTGDDLT